VLRVPLAARVALQPPVAVQAVAFVELHVNVETPPLGTTVGYTIKVAAGTTLTRTDDGALLPPAPVQVSEYALGSVREPVLCVPLVGKMPLHPPDAVQEVALADPQVSVEAPPPATIVGLAASVTVAAGMMATVAVTALLTPPAPEQTREYVAAAVRAAVLWLPLVGLLPLQAPEAVHEVALAELHVSIEALPLATAAGFAASETVAAGITVTAAVTTLLAPPAPVQLNEYDALAAIAPVL
jgi:hypothetical protein